MNDDLEPIADSRPQSPTSPPSEVPARRRPRLRAATLLNAGGVIAAAVTVAALEPKLPHYVGD